MIKNNNYYIMGKKGKVGSVRKKINKKVQRKTCKKKQMKGGSNKNPNKSRKSHKRHNPSVNKNKKKQTTSNTRTDEDIRTDKKWIESNSGVLSVVKGKLEIIKPENDKVTYSGWFEKLFPDLFPEKVIKTFTKKK